MENICIFCDENIASSSEHVFPFGLGGENIFIDCMCTRCNNSFSGIETELLENSPIAFMRTVEGLEGYKRNTNKLRPASLPSPEMLQYVEEDNVAYEVGIYKELHAFVRPQLIQIKGDIYIEGASKKEMLEFCNLLLEWKNQNPILVAKYDRHDSSKTNILRFEKSESTFIAESVSASNLKKAMRFFIVLSSHQYFQILEPRISLDHRKRLYLRARNIKEGIEFICNLLRKIEFEQANFSSFSPKETNQLISNVMSFNVIKFNKAIVKIAVNLIIHYFPSLRTTTTILNAIKYLKKNDDAKEVKLGSFEKADTLLDKFEGCHTVAFIQRDTMVEVRLSLFKGSYVQSIYFANLELPDWNTPIHSVVIINFKNRKQRFLKYNELLHFTSEYFSSINRV